jgi:hypothetical protein
VGDKAMVKEIKHEKRKKKKSTRTEYRQKRESNEKLKLEVTTNREPQEGRSVSLPGATQPKRIKMNCRNELGSRRENECG